MLLVKTKQEAPDADVRTVLASILRHPLRLIGSQWNFKTAVLSAAFRGVVFLAAVCRSHHVGKFEAILLETLYGAATAGVFGALAQSMRWARPKWIAETLLFLVFPLLFQLLEVAMHAVFGTGAFHAGMVASAALTGVSTVFNLYAMRRGALLVGVEGSTFQSDLGSLPKLALQMVLEVSAKFVKLIAVSAGYLCLRPRTGNEDSTSDQRMA